MRTLLVGLDNPHSVNPRDALLPAPGVGNGTGERVVELIRESAPRALADYSVADYERDFDRVNLYPVQNAVNGKGATKADKMMAQWCAMYAVQGGYQNVVLLGNRVRVAFADLAGLTDDDQIVEIGGRDLHFYVVPHPSGRNRFYNKPANRKNVGGCLASLRERRQQERAR